MAKCILFAFVFGSCTGNGTTPPDAYVWHEGAPIQLLE
jgi:hypothetical protein